MVIKRKKHARPPHLPPDWAYLSRKKSPKGGGRAKQATQAEQTTPQKHHKISTLPPPLHRLALSLMEDWRI